MLKSLNPFKKIDAADIEVLLSGGSLTFSYSFNPNQEKELNLAAGRIHRKTTSGAGAWKLEGYTLSTTYTLAKLEDNKFTFGDIAAYFEEMTK